MKVLREHTVSRITAMVTGVIFLNMSFFLSEIRLLSLDVKNHQMIEHLVKLMYGAGLEEERDCAGEGGESLDGEQVVDILMYLETSNTASLTLIFEHSPSVHREVLRSQLHSEISTPPPRIS